LRLARCQHQHAVRHDAVVELADQRTVAGGEGVAKIAFAPRGRVRGLLQRRDGGQIVFAHRPPEHRRLGARFDAAAHRGRPSARSALVSATLCRR
jgi:hypothetical protein